jgi:hypothetical protein
MNFTKVTIITMLLSMLIFSSCDYKKYAEGVKKDTQNRFNNNKSFLCRLSFEGLITKKEFCNDCELCKYKLYIKLSQLSEKPVISNSGYPPYYTFEKDSVLNIAVSKELYQQVKENDKIYKEKESFNLKLDNKELIYLNKEKNEWFPQ